MPIITLTSEIKDGYITGIIEYTAATNLTGGLENFPFVFNVILAEGYHKYGSEEHYFIPRTAGYLSSAPIATLGDLAGKKTGATFSFPIDKS